MYAYEPSDYIDGIQQFSPTHWMPLPSLPNAEPRYAPCNCSPALLSELDRIANDYIPDNDGQAPLALSEMREALQSLLANANNERQI